LSRTIIEAHGGQLTTGGDARGTVVRLTLPAVTNRYDWGHSYRADRQRSGRPRFASTISRTKRGEDILLFGSRRFSGEQQG
jgi:hypothetical protein